VCPQSGRGLAEELEEAGSPAFVLAHTVLQLTDPIGPLAKSCGAGAPREVVRHLCCPRKGPDLFAFLHRLLDVREPSNGFPALSQELVSTALARSLSALRDEDAPIASGRLLGLACVPLLWRRCPQLAELAPRLLTVLEPTLGALSDAGEVLAALPESTCGGRAGSLAALLGNIVEGAPSILAKAEAEGSGREAAAGLCRVLLRLLPAAPMRALFPGDGSAAGETGEEDEEDEEDEDEGGRGTRRGRAESEPSWEGAHPPTPALREQVGALFQPPLLKRLVDMMIDKGAPPGGRGAADEPSEALCLCRLLRAASHAARRANPSSQVSERLHTSLAFSAGLVQRLWTGYLKPRLAGQSWDSSYAELGDPGWMLPLSVLCPVYTCALSGVSADDSLPLPPREVYDAAAPREGLLHLLKSALWHILWVEGQSSLGSAPGPALALRADLRVGAGRLLRQLNDRNTVRRFAAPEAFLAEELHHERFSSEVAALLSGLGGFDSACESQSRAWAVLRHAPCLVPFQERARAFQMLVSVDRRQRPHEVPPVHFADTEVRHARRLEAARRRHMDNSLAPAQDGWPGEQPFDPDLDAPQAAWPVGHPNRSLVAIRRDFIVEDGFAALNGLGPGLKNRIRVQFVNQFGAVEAGVDGGGLFKDFIWETVRKAFDPQYGFFKATSDHFLYPNPAAGMLHPNAAAMFEYLGRILGKAIYEGILLDLPLAGFFLKKFQSLRNNDISDLSSLDPELYKQLMFLRSYEGDVSELALTFSITSSEMGQTREVDLIPGGSSIPVTSENRVSYIVFVANYRLNRAIAPACAAFLRGVHELIPAAWLQMFNEEELRTLICGSSAGIDIEDLKANVEYGGEYHEHHPVISMFWEVVSEMPPGEQEALLRFVTSCSRPPLLGFKYLEPKLCIQPAGGTCGASSEARLPTASTCMNLLKLPPYQSKEVMIQKIRYSTSSGAGFDLS